MKRIKSLLYFIVFVGCCLFVGQYIKKRHENLLKKNTYQTLAIYENNLVMRNRGPVSFFNYKVKKIVFTIDINGKYDFLKKGDTVLIIYSKEDPSVGKVIDFCYMKKHKGKDYCNCLDE